MSLSQKEVYLFAKKIMATKKRPYEDNDTVAKNLMRQFNEASDDTCTLFHESVVTSKTVVSTPSRQKRHCNKADVLKNYDMLREQICTTPVKL